MHKIQYYDKTYVVIRDDQVEQVTAAIARNKPFWLNHQNGRDFIKPGAVALIKKARYGEYTPDPNIKKLEAPTVESTDEQRAETLRKIQEVKRKASWYKRKV